MKLPNHFPTSFCPISMTGTGKIQNPKSKLQKNFKPPAPNCAHPFGAWNWGLFWSLKFGVWSFFSPAAISPPRRQHSRAFTLLEIMVALAIFVMIVATIYSTFILIVKSKVVAQQAAAQAQRERIAIRTVENSLMCVQSYQASMKYYSFVVENGDEPVFSFTSYLPDVFPRNGKFGDFTLRRLTYSVEPGADQDKNLVLRQTPILMDMDEDEKTVPLILARNIKSFIVECWDTNNMAWDTEWDLTNSIPPLVRVTFTLGSHTAYGNDGPSTTLSRVIALSGSTVPLSEQQPYGGGGLPPSGPGGIPQMNQ